MSNDRKDELLGMDHGKASHQLRKMVLFKLVQMLNLASCFRCHKEIQFVQDLSIEHKDSWQSAENPKESFFDLSNIAFSHLRCNSGAAYRKTIDPPKGQLWCWKCKKFKIIENFHGGNSKRQPCRLCSNRIKQDWRQRTGKH